MIDVSGDIIQKWQNAGGTIAIVNGRENHKWHTGSNPVLTTEGANPETLKEKVGDSSERRAFLKKLYEL
jgi:hypothetical protein